MLLCDSTVGARGGAGPDRAFPWQAFHCVGATADACRVAFDKPMAKAIAAAAGVTTAPSVTLPNEVFHSLGGAAVLDRIVTTLGL